MEPERLVFPMMVDGLVRAAGSALTPSLKSALRQKGLDLDAKLPPGWAVTHVGDWLDLVAEARLPGAPRDEALRDLGRAFVHAWQGTLIGGAMSVVLRTVGPARSLARLQRAFRTGDNFTVVTVTDLDAPPPWRLSRVHINDVLGRPAYYLGVLEQGAALVGAKNAQVTLEQVEGSSVTFHLRYQP